MKDSDQIKRREAERDLLAFIQLVHPDRMLGHVHEELISWWNRPEASTHQLTLLPRDHQKSALLAYRVAWEITRNPAVRILYISATSTLAVKQLGFIKNILTSDNYRRFWPEMINERMADRAKWTETEIMVDHKARKDENIRDSTIFTAGLTTVITGLHADIICLDDVVIDDNAKTKEARDEVKERVSYLASIAGTESKLWVVGTRYHPEDLYATFLEANYRLYDEDGNPGEEHYLYEVFERQVEDRGDGTGNYLWPRKQRYDGKWFGFNQEILAKKKAQYFDLAKFRAQYYNNPNSEEDSVLKKELFQYYNKEHLHQRNGAWYFKERRLNLVAAMDLAFSIRKGSDYTAIVVAGIDGSGNIYVLDIERFKTEKINEYFEKILKLYIKWNFRKIRIEISAAQRGTVRALKDDYIKTHGLALSVEEYEPLKKVSKEDRIEASLYPKYLSQLVWHYRGGNCELLEEELINLRPKHDDIKDAFASCIDILIPPSNMIKHDIERRNTGGSNVIWNTRFGGIS